MENEIDENRYADGFNKGYILSEHESEIAKSFIENVSFAYDEFLDGFKNGLLQAQQEKTVSDFDKIRNQNKERDTGLER